MGRYLVLDNEMIRLKAGEVFRLPWEDGINSVLEDREDVHLLWSAVAGENRVPQFFRKVPYRRVKTSLMYAGVADAWVREQVASSQDVSMVVDRVADRIVLVALSHGERLEERVIPWSDTETMVDEIRRTIRRVIPSGHESWHCLVNDPDMAQALHVSLGEEDRVVYSVSSPTGAPAGQVGLKWIVDPPEEINRRKGLESFKKESLFYSGCLVLIIVAMGGSWQTRQSLAKAREALQQQEEQVSREHAKAAQLAVEKYRSYLKSQNPLSLEVLFSDLLSSVPPQWRLSRFVENRDENGVLRVEAFLEGTAVVSIRGKGLWERARVIQTTRDGKLVRHLSMEYSGRSQP